jgi:ornithine--oxo-acid transaminase
MYSLLSSLFSLSCRSSVNSILSRNRTLAIPADRVVHIFRTTTGSVRSLSSNDYIHLDRQYVGHTYEPLPVVLVYGKGIHVYDTTNKLYIDFLSGYSALNLGHNHPRVVETLQKQASKLSLTSRAFYNDQLSLYAEYLTKLFQYDMMVPMNTGVEAGETACKLARKFGYRKKGVPMNQGLILMAKGNFWGRTITAISTSDDPLAYQDYGPFVPGFKNIPYGDPEALENELFTNSNIIAYYVEPIQGEAGIIVPPPGYLQAIYKICKR